MCSVASRVRERSGLDGVYVERLVERVEKGKLPWREAGPLNHPDDKVDSDQ